FSTNRRGEGFLSKFALDSGTKRGRRPASCAGRASDRLVGRLTPFAMNPSARKVALITGSGAQRVGWHIAEALAGQGYDLVVHYHSSATAAVDTVRHLQSKGAQVLGVAADLTDESAVRGLITQTLERFGRLDALVNCAAVWK